MSWLTGYQYRIPITIDHTKINADLEYFPLPIKLSGTAYSDVFAKVGSHYEKISVTASDGLTELFVNVQKWDAVGGEAWIVVGVPNVSSTQDTILYLYYDSNARDARWAASLADLSDDFTGADNDPPSLMKWRIVKGSYSIQSNHLSVSVSSSNHSNKLVLKSMLWGDFDIQVEGHVDSTPSTHWWVMNLVLHFPSDNAHWCYVGRGYDSTNGQFIRSRYNKGTSTTEDYDTITDADFTLRLVREGSIIKYYYKTTGGWVQLSHTEMYSSPAVVSLEFSCGSGYPSVSGYFDYFTITSAERATGYVGRAGSFMGSGVWDNDHMIATSMVDCKDYSVFLTRSDYNGSQGLAADGTYFYWGKNNGSGVNGTIYKFQYDGTDVASFDGPPHSAGGDIHGANDTLLFCTGGSEPYKIWEISKTGTKLRDWDLSSVDYGTGGLVCWKNGATIYAFTSDRTSPYAFKVREVTLHNDGTYTLGSVWSHSGLGVPQGLEYVDGRLLYLADHDSQISIFELLLRGDGSIDYVEYKTGITDESEGLAWDGDSLFFGTYTPHKIYKVEDLVDIADLKLNTDHMRDEVITDRFRILTKGASNAPQATNTSFAGGQDFDGADDYISVGNPGSYLDVLGDSDVTVEAVANTSDTTTWSTIYGARTSGQTPLLHFRKDSSNKLRIWKQDDGGDDLQAVSTSTIADGADHHLVGIIEGTNARLYIDTNEQLSASNPSVGPADLSSVDHIIGRKYSDAGPDYWQDVIAWLTVSKTARSSAWIVASKNALFNTLVSAGAPESSGNLWLEDLSLDLQAYYRDVQDLGMNLSMQYGSLEDLGLDIDAHALEIQDVGIDINAAILAFQDITGDLVAAAYSLEDIGLDVDAADGLVLEDLLLDASLSDGTWYDDLSLNVVVSNKVPEFRAIYAMHLLSVISEVT